MSLIQSLLSEDFGVLDIPFIRPKIIFAKFDPVHGSSIPNMDPSYPENLQMVLFPAKWLAGQPFLLKFDSKYFLTIGVLALLIQTSRGPLQVSISLMQTSFSFSENHFQFLRLCKTYCEQNTEISEDKLLEVGISAGINFNRPEENLVHPLNCFLKSKIKVKAHNLITLWKLRILRKKIMIDINDNLSDITELCYFLSILCLPFRSNDDCAFCVDLSNPAIPSDLVIGICHPLIEKNGVILNSNYEIILNQNFQSITKGSGSFYDEVKDVLNKSDTLSLARLFIEENKKIIRCLKAQTSNDSGRFNSIGMNSNNIDFFNEINQLYHFTSVNFEKKGCCC